jgi:hypothetical protein
MHLVVALLACLRPSFTTTHFQTAKSTKAKQTVKKRSLVSIQHFYHTQVCKGLGSLGSLVLFIVASTIADLLLFNFLR